MSLEESHRTTVTFAGGGISQEDQDVSRALEASLLETLQSSGGKRKRNENWTDPLNPHERERNGTVNSFFEKNLVEVSWTQRPLFCQSI